MNKETAPALQARDIARNDLFNQVKATIESKRSKFERSSDLYRLVMFIVDGKLYRGTFDLMNLAKIMPNIPWSARYAVFDVLTPFSKFKDAPEECSALLAKIFEWATAQIANLVMLQALKVSNPLLIYGVAERTTEVPIE